MNDPTLTLLCKTCIRDMQPRSKRAGEQEGKGEKKKKKKKREQTTMLLFFRRVQLAFSCAVTQVSLFVALQQILAPQCHSSKSSETRRTTVHTTYLFTFWSLLWLLLLVVAPLS